MSEISGRSSIDGHALAWRRIEGRGPTVVWLGGFGSEMAGAKATALAAWAEAGGRDFLRFDYFGHGLSEGRLEGGTISRWRRDALAVIDGLAPAGPLVLVGSSMGGWIACLAALARPERVAGLVLVAPAVDFTERLLQPRLPREALRALEREGVWRPAAGFPISRRLLEDGRRWSLLPGPIAIAAPARILQGGEDLDVPWTHGLEVAKALEGPDVVFSLIRDGDHRLSRPADIARIIAATEELAAAPPR